MTTKTELRVFDRYSEFVDAAEARANRAAPSHSRGDGKWAGGCDFKAALGYARDGWQAEIAAAEALSAHVADTVLADRLVETFEATWDVAGAEVDMSRYLSGTPECMIEAVPIRLSKRGRAVRLVVPYAYSAGIEPGLIRLRGAAILALVQCLRRAQHPLEIWAVEPITGGRGGRYCVSVCVQHADEEVDEGRLMFALAHPAMLRRITFGYEEGEDAATRRRFGFGPDGFGYGQPDEATEADVPAVDDGTTIVLPQLRLGHKWDHDAAVRWIEEQLDRIFD